MSKQKQEIWQLHLTKTWPFGIRITEGQKTILDEPAFCHATEQKTRLDNERGVGFPTSKRNGRTTASEATAFIAEQDAKGHLIAAAPDMLAALKAFTNWYDTDSSEFNRDTAYYDALTAIAKAEGKTSLTRNIRTHI